MICPPSQVSEKLLVGRSRRWCRPFDWLAQSMGAAGGWLFEAVWNVFDATTLVDIICASYLSVYNLLFGIAVFVMLIFFCLQLRSDARQEGS